jgi:cytochrome c oxidase assembly protein subunit 15
MTLDQFKQIFFWEWAHRAYGRLIGVAFAVPFVYFLARGRIPRREALKLTGIFGLGGLQGLIGWWMVKSGLNVKKNEVARVSHLRLATHLGSAFLIYTLLLWQAMRWQVRRVATQALPANIRALRIGAHVCATMVFSTAMSGALVAGLDAGLIYNHEFPLMGGRVFPADGLALSPVWRNFIDNAAAVQFDHRWLGMSTGTVIAGTYWAARRGGSQSVYAALHPAGRWALNAMLFAVLGQITLGITTLMTFVPVALGAAHQAGSLTVLSTTLWLMHEVKRPRRLLRVVRP